MTNFKHAAKLKEFYSEDLGIRCLDFTIIIHILALSPVSPATVLSLHPSLRLIFFYSFQSELLALAHFLTDISTCTIIIYFHA